MSPRSSLFSPWPDARWSPTPAARDRVLKGLEAMVGAPILTAADGFGDLVHDESGAGDFAPDVVVRAASSAEVSAVLSLATREGVPVTPRGAGTGKSGGCLAVCGGILLLTEMNAVRAISPEHHFAVVEPGVITGALQSQVETLHRFYPPDPASLDASTIAGNIAENAGGPRAVKYGVTRDYVMALEAVLPTGEIVRTGHRSGKGVVGYDLTALLTGSEGTLAVITEATLRLVPLPRAVETALVTFSSLAAASRVLVDVAATGVVPRTLELLDRTAIDAVRGRGPGLFGAGCEAALIIEVDGSHAHVLDDLAQVVEVCERGDGASAVAQSEAQRRAIWGARREVSSALKKLGKHKISEDVAVPRGHMAAMIARIGEIAEREGLLHSAYGHAGDGHLHVNYIWNDDGAIEAVRRALAATFAAAVEFGGTISGEHGVGLIKREFVALEQAPALIGLQRRLKRVFDPAGVLNPGKMFPFERDAILNGG